MSKECKFIKEMKNQCGFSLIYIVGALVALSAIATAVTTLTPSSTLTELNQNRFGQAYYAAYSGITYSRTLSDLGLSAVNKSTNSKQTYSIGDATFTIVVGAKSGTTYPVRSIGTSNSSSALENNFLLGPVSITPVSSSLRPPSIGGGETGKKVHVAGYVGGNVAAEIVEIHDGSRITGTVTSTSTTATLKIVGGVSVGGQVCSNDGVIISGGSNVVSGNVYSHGDVLIDGGATVNGDILATGNVTVDGGARINGNIHSQGAVNFNNGRMGSSSMKRYIYARSTVTVTGGSTIYVDINSQANIALQNITIYGDVYYKTGITKWQWQTHLYGNEGTNPTSPTMPIGCGTYVAPSPIVFTANQSGPTIHGSTTYSAGDYFLTSFKTGNWSSDKICFDTSGGNINLFVAGDVESGSKIYVKTSSVDNCFSKEVRRIDEPYASEASKVFIYSTGKFTLLPGANWFGTVLAVGDIQPGGGSEIIGSLHSINGTINPGNVWYDINVVELGE